MQVVVLSWRRWSTLEKPKGVIKHGQSGDKGKTGHKTQNKDKQQTKTKTQTNKKQIKAN